MKQKVIGLALCALLFAVSVSTQAQQPKKVPRIGYLSPFDPATESTRAQGIRMSLREHGYIQGQNITIDYRCAEGRLEWFPELAAELVRLRLMSS